MVSGGWAVAPPTAYESSVTNLSSGADQYYPIEGSFPSGPYSWTVVFSNVGQGDVTGVAHVECLSQGVTPTIVTSQSISAPNSSAQTSGCPQGSVLTGGGFEVTNATSRSLADVSTSWSVDGSSWTASTPPFGAGLTALSDGLSLKAFAVCAPNLIPSSTSYAVNKGCGPTASPSPPPPPGSSACVVALPQPFTGNPATDMVPTGAITYVSCPASMPIPIGSGYFNLPSNQGAFPFTLFFPSYGGTPPQWDVTAFDMPIPSFEGQGPFTPSGAVAIVRPICAII